MLSPLPFHFFLPLQSYLQVDPFLNLNINAVLYIFVPRPSYSFQFSSVFHLLLFVNYVSLLKLCSLHHLLRLPISSSFFFFLSLLLKHLRHCRSTCPLSSHFFIPRLPAFPTSFCSLNVIRKIYNVNLFFLVFPLRSNHLLYM